MIRKTILILFLFAPASLFSQGTLSDYERASNLRTQTQGLAYNSPERANWIGKSHRFWYRKTVKGGHEFVLVNADTLVKQPAFDHEKLAASLSTATGEKYTGIIFRPRSLDLSRKYPVIENIYAGPQGSFVPKTFSPFNPMQALAELGFIVVQMDGMGTSNRSKAFHDVCWKNLGDAGFPDRILWHKAVAAKYSYYDISHVGIYGTSAGGQSSMGALLFHPEFYKVAVSNSGSHDNRMDKIWWNEQWMGYLLGPQYSASSNVDNASKLQGKLLLVAGEMDTNVDPSSTFQVANALIKAKKYFDLMFVPGGGHGAGGEYGERKRNDFFAHHLLGVEPPDWNTIEQK